MNEMKLVENEAQIRDNLRTFDGYIAKGSDEDRRWAKDRIRQGRCFLAYRVGNELHFATSLFLGYVNNTREKHDEAKRVSGFKKDFSNKSGTSKTKDGRDTNDAITEALECELLSQDSMDSSKYNEFDDAFMEYCRKNEIHHTGTFGSDKSFWSKILEL